MATSTGSASLGEAVVINNRIRSRTPGVSIRRQASVRSPSSTSPGCRRQMTVAPVVAVAGRPFAENRNLWSHQRHAIAGRHHRSDDPNRLPLTRANVVAPSPCKTAPLFPGISVAPNDATMLYKLFFVALAEDIKSITGVS